MFCVQKDQSDNWDCFLNQFKVVASNPLTVSLQQLRYEKNKVTAADFSTSAVYTDGSVNFGTTGFTSLWDSGVSTTTALNTAIRNTAAETSDGTKPVWSKTGNWCYTDMLCYWKIDSYPLTKEASEDTYAAGGVAQLKYK